MLVATAGHIDHGKSSLLRALTGVETDRLPEERERGVSIDLGFAYWRPRVEGAGTIGFVDVPGHERYVRNMLAGLGGIDLALLVVAADDGIMPQTREHLAILDLMGFSHALLTITKCDRVDAARIAQVRKDLAMLLAQTPFSDSPVFEVSAVTGQGVDALGTALIERAVGSRAVHDDARLARLAIDRAFTVRGSGTVVTGTLLGGTVAQGDELLVLPTGKPVRVRSLQAAGKTVESVVGGERCAVNLAGLNLTDVHRGMWLASPALDRTSDRMEVKLRVPQDGAGVRHNQLLVLHTGTAAIRARLLLPGQRKLEAGTDTIARLLLDEPTLAVTGQRFVLRDSSGQVLLGGGAVLDPFLPRDRRALARRTGVTEALQADTATAALRMLARSGDVDRAWFARCHALRDTDVAQMCADLDLVEAARGGAVMVARDRLIALQERILTAIAAHHSAHPDEGGLSMQALEGRVDHVGAPATFAACVSGLVEARRLEQAGPLLRLPGHEASFSESETRQWETLREFLSAERIRAIAIVDAARQLGIGEADARALLYRRRIAGDAWDVAPTRFMLREHVAELAECAARLDAATGGFTAAEFRDASGIGRNLVIVVLEFFDRIGIARRHGDRRRMHDHWERLTGRPPVATGA